MQPSKANIRHRVSCTNCCVVGCHNNYSNTDRSVKFYSFPSKPHELERRQQWINAIKKSKSQDRLKDWEPKAHSRICSQHFIGNEKSNHPNSPAFLPTIFPGIYKKKITNSNSKVARFDRHLKRNDVKNFPEPSTSTKDSVVRMPEIDCNDGTVGHQDVKLFCTQATQVNFGSDNNSFLFECEYYHHNEVATSCNITSTSNRIKKYEDKSVGPNVGEH